MQWLFIVEGVPSVLVGLWALRYVTDKPINAAWLFPDERVALQERIDHERKSREAIRHYKLGEALTNPRVLGLSLCRFSDAGNDDLTTRSGGRRPKSAKARSRGKLATGWQRALWGFELSAEVGGGRNSGVIRAARVHGRGIERLPGAFRHAFWADGGANGALLEVIG